MKIGSQIRIARQEDLPRIREIFNVYVRESSAAYPIQDVEAGFFEKLYRESTSTTLYVVDCGKEVVGFGLIRPYLPFPSFQRAAQVSYFIDPRYTRKGLGGKLLDQIIRDARSGGIHILLANISSRNEPSLRFHEKHGFSESGRLRGIGEKFGNRFDVVWMQRAV